MQNGHLDPAGTRVPPSAKSLPVVGALFELAPNAPEVLRHWATSLGDVCRFQLGALSCYLVSDPALIERVLLTDSKNYIKDRALYDLSIAFGSGLMTTDGESWLKQRRVAQPAFHQKRLQAYADVMVDYTVRLLEAWPAETGRGLHRELLGLTTEIVLQCLFGADVSRAQVDDVRDALQAGNLVYRYYRPSVFPTLSRIPTPGRQKLWSGIEKVNTLIHDIMSRRREQKQEADDLLSMLMAVRDEKGEAMPDKQLRSEIMTMFIAGAETTAVALYWAFHLLEAHPPIAAKLISEIDAVTNGRRPSYTDFAKLKYTEAVIKEAMRLYPPAWVVGREAAVDVQLGPYVIPKGAQVLMSTYAVQRDARHFERPDDFLPERWLDGSATGAPKYAYFPFGGGPRVCIGNSFAMVESSLVVATMLQKVMVKFDVPPALGASLKTLPSITLRPRHDAQVRLQSRVEELPADLMSTG